MEIILDSSAVSRLYELPPSDRDALLKGLRMLGRIRITAVNVVEAAAYGNQVERERKLAFYGSVTGEISPMDLPGDVLRKSAKAYLSRSKKIEIGDETAFYIVKNPTSVDSELHRLEAAFNAERDDSFRTFHDELRPKYQEIFDQHPGIRFENAPQLVEYFCERASTYTEMFLRPMFARAVEPMTVTLSDSQIVDFVKHCDAWKLFWCGRIHALFSRCVPETGFGHKKKADQNDLESAVYLSFCDRFITHDVDQFKVLSSVNTFNSRPCVVQRWSDIVKMLVRSS